MSHLNLFIKTDNAAFHEGGVEEIKAVIAQAVAKLDRGGAGGMLRDSYGNTVGVWKHSDEGGEPIRFTDDENAAVVVVGSPVGGLRFVGPFASRFEAEQFLESADWGDEDDRWAAELAPGL